MSAPFPTSVDVTWNLEDARAWGAIVVSRHAALAAGAHGQRKWGQGIALGGMIATSAATYVLTWSPAVAVAGAVLGYSLTVAGQWAHHWDQQGPGPVDVIFQKDRRAYDPRRFEMTDVGLVETRSGLTGTVEWGRIDQLTREAGLIIVWISKLDGLPIPESCFGAKAEADAFHAEIERQMAARNPAA